MSDKEPEALAIKGGQAVRSTPMPARVALGAGEFERIKEVIEYYQGHDLDPGYQGVFEEQYCDAFCKMMGGGYADAVSTGSASIFVAIAALSLPEGSEVLVSPITDPGTLSAITMQGLVPSLVDSAPGLFNIGAEQVASRISSKTSALVCVHSLGAPIFDIEEIVRICNKNGVKVVEDCSQSHMAEVAGQKVGCFGDIAAFSTMYRKTHITGASGGLVYSRSIETYRNALAHADRGKPRWIEDFDDRDPNGFLFPALNFHTDEISCGIGISSLDRVNETKLQRTKYLQGVKEQLESEVESCRVTMPVEGVSPFVVPVIVDSSKLSVSKVTFAKAVLAEGIGLNPHYQYLVRDWPWLQKYLSDNYETVHAREIRDNSFMLYCNENYGPQEIRDTVMAIYKVEQAYLHS